MRSADIVTLSRIPIMLLIIYLILIQFNPWITILLIAIVMLFDGLDGYFAIREQSKGKISFGRYLSAALGNKKNKDIVSKSKHSIQKSTPYGPRMDIAGDRFIEYSFWVVFTYVHILPIYVIILILIRHSFVDALMGARGTSSKMKTAFGRMMYSSNIARGGVNVVKFVAFSYLVLMYVANYPAIVGYALTAILVVYILLRGIAEIYESFA